MKRFSLRCAQSLLFVAPLAISLLVSVARFDRKPTITNSTIPIFT
jgi:hypothetical protein